MRIAVLNLTGGGLSGGYRKYLRCLLPRLGAHPGVADLLIVVPPGQEDLSCGVPVEPWPAGDQWRGFAALRARVRAWRPDVVFIPTSRWIGAGAPTVVMVRNMEPLARPFGGGSVATGLRNLVHASVARRSVLRATRVIAVSEFVRQHLVDRWCLPEDRVSVVYHGVDPADAMAGGTSAQAEEPFLFAAGSLLPYRGLEDAVDALALLVEPPVDRLTLVIAGDGSAAYRAAIARRAAERGVSARVRWVGHLDAQGMARGFTEALAFLMTSRVEACPNTALEAMAHGSPCISTLAPPMPEFFGDAALFYGPGDAATLAAHVRRLATDAAMRRALGASGQERALGFTWDETVRRTVAELRRALGRNANGSHPEG
ncbi:MAG: glycosyltransferase [Gemmatimonadota bacterium]